LPGLQGHNPVGRVSEAPPGKNKPQTLKSKNPAGAGFFTEWLKLTGKPRSFIESGVDSHSSHLAQKAKTPPERGFVKS
jgi:hypothetical protein